ncbi:regulatory protein RecX [Microbacterium sp. 179-I 3D2 NHS]|uniref:regulatory protein RecX n=1 Tax=Microbacterium sp. 179-I 3D2 NHS TaxID=3235178 RepID=UPI0039A2591B
MPKRTGDAGLWRSTWSSPAGPAPLDDLRDGGTPSDRHPARGGAGGRNETSASGSSATPKLRALRDPQASVAPIADGVTVDERSSDEIRAAAEEALLRKLRTKSLSIAEARLVLKGHDLDAAGVDDVIDDFVRLRYLDDAVLAELLVTSGVERKGQGRVALSRALSQRGIPREVIDAALDTLPDDDAERALDYARSKARSLSRLDGDTALRRLVGQLSRRGYGGAVAMQAAKEALREANGGTSGGGTSSGVRFVDSD